MVFETFGVGLGGFGRDAEAEEKGDDEFVAAAAGFGEVAAGRGEGDGFVGRGVDEAAFLEALDRLDGGGVGDAEAAGEIGDAGLAGFGDEFGDGFDVIFGRFEVVLAAGQGVAAGAGGLGGHAEGGGRTEMRKGSLTIPICRASYK